MNNQERVSYLVEKLGFLPHPEGGFYKETYRSEDVLSKAGLPNRFAGDRVASTLIYYLLSGNDFSAFHRIKSDESWHYYEGTSALLVYELKPNGDYVEHRLAKGFEGEATYQTVIEAGSWFGSCLGDEEGYCLVGCGVAPGFDFEDFDMAERAALLKSFPDRGEVITKLTRL